MKIGIIRTSSIGDVVLATAALDLIERLAHQGQEPVSVLWIGREPSLGVIGAGRTNVSGMELPSRASAERLKLILDSLKKCDVVVDLQTSFRTKQIILALKRSKVPVVSARKQTLRRLLLVLSARLRGRFLPLKSAQITAQDLQFEMMRKAVEKGLSRGGVSLVDHANQSCPRLIRNRFSMNDEPWARELSFGSWIAVAPGASYETKRAPTEILSQIFKNMSHDSGIDAFGIVLLGGSDDRAAAVELMDTTVWKGPVMNLAGKLTLAQTTAVLTAVRGLVCNDSGLAHIAEAVGTPVVVLFGPTIESFGFSPRDPRSRAFSSNLGCRPCSKHGQSSCRYGDKLCFLAIDTQLVTERVRGFLSHHRESQ
jgi:ADP-heptose:LPS heptosyltransferase